MVVRISRLVGKHVHQTQDHRDGIMILLLCKHQIDWRLLDSSYLCIFMIFQCNCSRLVVPGARVSLSCRGEFVVMVRG